MKMSKSISMQMQLKLQSRPNAAVSFCLKFNSLTVLVSMIQVQLELMSYCLESWCTILRLKTSWIAQVCQLSCNALWYLKAKELLWVMLKLWLDSWWLLPSPTLDILLKSYKMVSSQRSWLFSQLSLDMKSIFQSRHNQRKREKVKRQTLHREQTKRFSKLWS